MTPSDDWRCAATAEQVGALTRTIDPTVAHIARVQDYWLGGKDHFEADRVAGDEAIAQLPDMAASVRNTRAFLGRTVRFLAAEQGVRAPRFSPPALTRTTDGKPLSPAPLAAALAARRSRPPARPPKPPARPPSPPLLAFSGRRDRAEGVESERIPFRCY